MVKKSWGQLVGLFSTLCGLLLLGLGGYAQTTAYVGATVIDGNGGAPVNNAVVLVKGERIVAVGSSVEIPPDTHIVDIPGKWIVPGLIDAHIHFMTSGRMYTRPAFFDLTDKVSYEEEIAWIRTHLADTLRAHLCAGVTGVLSLGGPSLEYEARTMAAAMPDAPSVFIGHGVIAHVPKFVAERTIPPWDGEMTIKPVTSRDDAAAVVAEAVANGADLIKTAVDDRGSRLMAAMAWALDWRELESFIIEEAARHGLVVTTHAHALEYARGMMELGVASLQHIPADKPVDEEFIRLARAKEVIVVPTLAIRKRTFIELFTKQINLLPVEQRCSVPGVVASWYEPLPPMDDQSKRYRVQGEMAAANAKRLYDGGVSLAVATDAGMIGLAHGSSMHLELRALNDAGIPADYLIQAATLNSAKVTGKEADYGTVEPGKYADFLILSADPVRDISNLQAIESVIKSGQLFDQQTLLPFDQADD